MAIQTQPADPIKPPASDEVQYKHCQSCCANLPLSHFGMHKMNRNGRHKICSPCQSQYQRLLRKRKFNSISKVDDSILRSVLNHNKAILDMVLSLSTCDISMVAFSTKTKDDYRVVFGKSLTLGLNAICVFSADGSMLRELAYSGGLSTIKDELVSFLKALNLRLELTDVDAINSKQTIYYV